jgi:2-polyprenyl-6-methoxyphenol hydroxylase-like FAD-dependent oxidoreductase
MNDDVLARITTLSADRRALLVKKLAAQASRVPLQPGEYDVAIIGGGAAGMTLALQLAKGGQRIRVVVLERDQHPVPETVHKVGESTVEIAAHYLRDVIGLDEHLRTQQLRKFGLRMFFSTHDNTDIGQRIEVGSSVFPPLSTYQLDRGRLENALAKLCSERGLPDAVQGGECPPRCR